MFLIDVFSRILHVSTAVTLVGGSTFLLLVFLPSTSAFEPAVGEKISSAVTGRWKRFVHSGVLLFLVTGFYNYYRAIPLHKGDGLYHALVGTKMLLAFGVFFLAAALVGRSGKLSFIRENRKRWLGVLVTLAAVIVAISGFVKVRGTAAGPPAPEAVSASSEGPSADLGPPTVTRPAAINSARLQKDSREVTR